MTRVSYCPCTLIKSFLGKFCKEANETAKKCIICTFFAGICGGIASALAAEEPCAPQQTAVTKVIMTPITVVTEFFGIPCIQSQMLKIANAGNRQVQESLKDNPFYNSPANTHEFLRF
ncbi:MAG: hypothetical protein KBC35_01145 [Candidatus Pacebacteria bacterium]|nr:hypothetical protein [Candidatus Paceibacterota bacterium]